MLMSNKMKKIPAYILSLLGTLIFSMTSPALVLAVTNPSASLSFDPLTAGINRGCSVAINVVVDTGTAPNNAQTDGTDAIIKYDPAVFSVSVNSIQNGTIYTDYPGNSVDTAGGKISISGLASVSQAFSGTGVLATLNLTVKNDAPTKATDLTFDFDTNDPTKTTDSNVVERQTVQDVLRTVNNGQYTVGTGNCSGQTGTSTTPSPTPATATKVAVPNIGGTTTIPGGETKTPYSSPSALTKTGDSTTTFIFIMLGSTLTVLGILGLALL